jgi:hypothetical protein
MGVTHKEYSAGISALIALSLLAAAGVNFGVAMVIAGVIYYFAARPSGAERRQQKGREWRTDAQPRASLVGNNRPRCARCGINLESRSGNTLYTVGCRTCAARRAADLRRASLQKR